ncbi:hypothetical protein [Parapedobacter koreensis]|uniref:Galactose oxidase, central domain n=1 Tax=Parapedobacter koreensis TaxID=332977 RepID=A0A1H7PXQ2_9SPHI|nr:hypothetical protein [Parapedobacter koreensis]SEL40356.1 Galactose oxidase, central domain [Parapedobacter koreensis]
MFGKLSFYLGVLLLLWAGQVAGQGLRIKGNSYPIHERTAIDLFNYQPSLQHRTLSKRLQIRFELRLDQTHSYGSILRIKLENPAKILNLFCRKLDGGWLEFKLTEEGRDQLSVIQLDPKSFGMDQWITTVLQFEISSGQISWHLLDKKQTIPFAFSTITYENIYFGKNDISIDVADCSIRALEIALDENQYVFPLRESSGNTIHDVTGKPVASVERPVWLINESYYWKKTHTIRLQATGGYQFDQERGRMVFFDRNQLQFLDLSTHALTQYTLDNPLPLDIRLGNSFIDGEWLYVYEVNDLPIGSPTVVGINLETRETRIVSTAYIAMQLHHHTGQQTAGIPYLLFGGFGNDRYSNTFLSLDLKDGSWDTVGTNGDRIMARYFTSSFYDPDADQLFVFGGMGNEAGDNTLGRTYRYDLYRLDLKTFRLHKLWEDEWPGKALVPARNLVYDGSEAFFALLYPEYLSNSTLQLYRFSIADGAHQQLGDSIPIKSEKIKTNANLFFYKPLNTFYGITQEFAANEVSSEIQLYELKAPALTHAELTQYDDYQPKGPWPWYGWAIAIVACTAVAIIILRRRSLRQAAAMAPAPLHPEVATYPLPVRNAIYLFGKFEVIDKKGTHIAHLFSGRLKQVLLLFLSRYPGKGIESGELSALLWPDKEVAATKNIRGVTLNQFRKLLAYLDGIALVYADNHYQLQITGCFIDYLAFSEAYDRGEAYTPLTATILERGKFLKNTEHELLDDLKEDTEYKVVEILHRQVAEVFDNSQYERCIHLARLCLETSPIDLDALAYEIKSMLRLKQKVEAIRRFEHFKQFYENLMREPLPFTIDQLKD